MLTLTRTSQLALSLHHKHAGGVSEMSCIPATTIAVEEACANCGKEGTDAVKLKNCTACYLLKYCSVDCQKTHRKLHKKACKKRAAELKDDRLYGQGHERPEADFCPLCLLAIPFPMEEHERLYDCCTKTVCIGCDLARVRQGLSNICPFCRTPPPESEEETLKMIQKRVTARDPEALRKLGDIHRKGNFGLEKNVPRAMELWTEAAKHGSTEALADMGMAYYKGWGVAQDKAKGIHCWESAAMQGNMASRHTLGLLEFQNENLDRAVRHLLISAKMGPKDSLDEIKEFFTEGYITKAQFAEGLKGYQNAVEETKSPDREKAVVIRRELLNGSH